MKTIVTKSGKKITFRFPTKDDLQAIYRFAKRIEKEDTFILLNPEEPIDLKEERQYQKDLLKDIAERKKVHILAFYKDQIIGACHIEKGGRRQGHTGEMGISVLKAYRSEGIGKKLYQLVEKLAQKTIGISQVHLECFANNKVALSLYQSLGFKEFGRWPGSVKYKNQLIDKVLFYKDL